MYSTAEHRSSFLSTELHCTSFLYSGSPYLFNNKIHCFKRDKFFFHYFWKTCIIQSFPLKKFERRYAYTLHSYIDFCSPLTTTKISHFYGFVTPEKNVYQHNFFEGKPNFLWALDSVLRFKRFLPLLGVVTVGKSFYHYIFSDSRLILRLKKRDLGVHTGVIYSKRIWPTALVIIHNFMFFEIFQLSGSDKTPIRCVRKVTLTPK